MQASIEVTDFGDLEFHFVLDYDKELEEDVALTSLYSRVLKEDFEDSGYFRWNFFLSRESYQLVFGIISELFKICLDYNNKSEEYADLDVRAIKLIRALENFALIL